MPEFTPLTLILRREAGGQKANQEFVQRAIEIRSRRG